MKSILYSNLGWRLSSRGDLARSELATMVCHLLLWMNSYMERISDSLTYARQAADRHETRHVEPEHLLLGLLHDSDSNAAQLLASLGISVEALRDEVEQRLSSNVDRINPPRGRFLSWQAYEVTAAAHKEMRELRDRHLDTEHLLLALAEAEIEALMLRDLNRNVIIKALHELRAASSDNSAPATLPVNGSIQVSRIRNGSGERVRPTTEISIHDNRLLSYTVDAETKRITIHTLYADKEPHEYTDVVFSGVVAYHFEGDNFDTILFDITEHPIAKVVEANIELFLRKKNYGWPVVSYSTMPDLLRKLEEQNIRASVVSASYGMDGFVLAQEMHVLPAP